MHPRIILLNFTEAERRTIASAGYDVERGFIGEYESSGSSKLNHLLFSSPHPFYDYDVLFYNSEYSEELEDEFMGRCRNLMNEEGSLEPLKQFYYSSLCESVFHRERQRLLHSFTGRTQFHQVNKGRRECVLFLRIQ